MRHLHLKVHGQTQRQTNVAEIAGFRDLLKGLRYQESGQRYTELKNTARRAPDKTIVSYVPKVAPEGNQDASRLFY